MAEGLVALVTGGRRWQDRSFVYRSLAAFHKERPIREFVNGVAPEGVDLFCLEWADYHGIHTRQFPADWDTHEQKAGVLRNQQMIDENPDIDLGLVFPGERGTIDMTRRLRKAGIERVFIDPPSGTYNLARWG